MPSVDLQAPTNAHMADFAARCRSQAATTAAWMLKRRARDYTTRPAQLEILYPGLACVEPDRMIAIGEALRRNEAQIQRHSGQIDLYQVKAINAKAVVLLGRYRRRFTSRLAEVA
jgi:hypothetical protein